MKTICEYCNHVIRQLPYYENGHEFCSEKCRNDYAHDHQNGISTVGVMHKVAADDCIEPQPQG